MIHMALRNDFMNFSKCMHSVVDRLNRGIALAPWQADTIKRWFDFHAVAVHHHHRQTISKSS